MIKIKRQDCLEHHPSSATVHRAHHTMRQHKAQAQRRKVAESGTLHHQAGQAVLLNYSAHYKKIQLRMDPEAAQHLEKKDDRNLCSKNGHAISILSSARRTRTS